MLDFLDIFFPRKFPPDHVDFLIGNEKYFGCELNQFILYTLLHLPI